MQLRLVAPTPEDTRAIGGAVAPLLRRADAVALTGELGAGKTTLVQGIARALGYDGPVASPTFTLVREYPTASLTLAHVDVYRLERVQEVADLALQDFLEEGVLLVEWGDVVEALLPEDHLIVELTVPTEGEERAIAVRPVGGQWATRWERLEQVLESWRAS